MERLAALIEALPDPAITVDLRAVVLAANARATAAFPRLRIGDPVSFALRDPDVLAAVTRTLGAGTAEMTELHLRLPLERWFDAHVSPLTDGTALIVLRETTSVRRADRMRADFVANVSHELRTPLSAISGFIETLQGPARDDAAARARFLPIMAEQARRMSRLVDDLLSLSAIEQKAHVLPAGTADLGAVAAETLDALRHLAAERGVTLRFQPPQPPAVTVAGDRDELIRVVENLVENAIRYGGSGDVNVESSYPEGIIRIRDYGPGIAAAHLPRLTERFYRVDTASSREKGGTGLGLAIVKHIVARHRGRLEIASEPEKGSTFSVMIPLLAQ
jgi:two-component system, OmpR family, phosphate regulon sensor histidine kinase PhoR